MPTPSSLPVTCAIGPKDYNIYTNSQLPTTEEINRLPLKSEGNGELMVADVGHTEDGIVHPDANYSRRRAEIGVPGDP